MSTDLTKDSYHAVADRTGNSGASCAGIAAPLFHLDKTWQIIDANAAALSLLARFASPVIGASAKSIFPDAFGALFNKHCERAFRFGIETRFEEQYLPSDTWLEVYIYPSETGVVVLMHDAADRRQDAALVEDHARILEQMARGQTSQDVLESITGLAERHGSGLLVAVFANSNSPDKLRVAAGPSLPSGYLQTVETVDVRPDGSPVGQAAFTLKPVIVTDLLLEPCEPKFREATSRHGLRSCWALPLISTDQTRLGVLAVYRREPSRPTDVQLRLLHTAANLAGIALERQKVDESLRQKEQEYRSIVETVQDVLIVADTEGHIVEANPAASRVLRASYNELIGRQAMDMVRPDYHGVIRRLLEEVRQGHEFQASVAGIRRDGTSFPAEIMAAPFIYKDQRHLLTVVRDVTSRKKMEDSLRKTEESLRTVANGAPVILYSLDKEGVFTLSEGQALTSMGLRPGEMVGKNALEVYADYPTVVAHLKQALAGEPSRFTAELGERVYDSIVRPLRSHQGEIIGAVGMAIDTTEQALTAEALAESEDRFRASFQQAPLGSAHASLDGVVLRANEPIAELLGVPAQEIIGQRLRDWFAHPEDGLADSAAVQQLLATQLPRSSAMRTLKNAAGETFPVVVSLSIIRDRYGEVKHLVYTLTPLP